MTAPSGPGIRIGNDERTTAMTALDEHMSAGRLDPDEYGERAAQASVARTRDDLDALFTDLPEPHPFPAAPAPTPARKGPLPTADRALRRLAGESTLVRIAVLAVVAALAIVAIPFIAVGALLVFVVLPMLGCGWRGRRGWYGGRWRW